MVVWIEILFQRIIQHGINVTTCVVVWIEIYVLGAATPVLKVTTCVVVWIEIPQNVSFVDYLLSHHLRGGVD